MDMRDRYRDGPDAGLLVILGTFAIGLLLLASSLAASGFLLGAAVGQAVRASTAGPAVPAPGAPSGVPVVVAEQRPGLAGTPGIAIQDLVVEEDPTRLEIRLVGDWNPDAVEAVEAGFRALARQVAAPRPISFEVRLEELASGAQGQAGSVYTWVAGPSAPRLQVMRAPALLAQEPVPPRGLQVPHVVITINAGMRFDLGPSGRSTPAGDSLAAVVLHEAIHGIGFSDTVRCERTSCQVGYSRDGVRAWSLFDQYVVVGRTGERLVDLPERAVYAAVTGNDLWFRGPASLELTDGRGIRLYAPGGWSAGSSVAHLHEVYRRSPDALLTWDGGTTPGLVLGPATRAILADIGWTLR